MNILHLEMSRFFSRVIGKVAEEAGYQLTKPMIPLIRRGSRKSWP